MFLDIKITVDSVNLKILVKKLDFYGMNYKRKSLRLINYFFNYYIGHI